MAQMTREQKEYIQFSKRVTKWVIILTSVMLAVAMVFVYFGNFEQHQTSAIVSLYTSYVTVLGVSVGAYQGNSSLEKYTRAKYQYEDLLNKRPAEEETAG